MQNTPRIAALIASRNRPDLVDAMVERLRAASSLPIDFYVVECGTDRDKLSPYSTLWYADPEFRGKCYGHGLALDAARKAASQDAALAANGGYDYYWVLMNDVVFDDGVDAARILVETMEREARMAICSPTNADGGYPGADRRPGGGFRKVTTCDYLGFMLRRSAAEECGFLNPAFKWCWGAIHELSFACYRAGWFVAYSDDVAYTHLGGTTYGAPGTNTVSREAYQVEAKRFAHEYFAATYGDDWSERFFAATTGHAIEVDTFALHRELWSDGAFRASERSQSNNAALLPPSDAGLVRLHLGCGRDHREGWINVDTNADLGPDVVADVFDLAMYQDGSVDAIEANHLFEHLAHHDALRALKEWRRVLKPGGELFLELPDLDACIRILGRYSDDRGYDLGLIGIYGWPPMVEEEGVPQIHKWGWTQQTLCNALADAGFGAVDFGPITQTWRHAAKVGRDMRVRARAGSAASNRNEGTMQNVTQHSAQHESPSSATNRAPSSTQHGASSPVAAQTTERQPQTLALFAWPDYAQPGEVAHLFREFASRLVGRGAFLLRYDTSLDGPREAVVASIDAACAAALGQRPFDVVLIDHELDPVGWRQLGDMVEAAVVLPSSAQPDRRLGLALLRTRYISRFAQLVGATNAA